MNTPLECQLDPRIKAVWRISDAILLTIVFGCVALIGVFLGAVELQGAASWLGVYYLVCLVAYVAFLLVFMLVVTPLRYIRWRYQLFPDFLEITNGIIWRKHIVVPFIRVQNTDTKQGPILRAFGLASVTVSTAAGAVEIPGLRAEEADDVRDRAAELARIAREDV